MNMSIDKPMVLNRAEGTGGPQVETTKINETMPPRHGNSNMNMSMDKPMALNHAEGTRGPQVENVKISKR